ncbi:MAG: hypothetical protein ACYTEL_16685 [Planctomycetota bacterium]
MGEVEPIGNDPSPRVPQSDLDRGAGEHFGTNENDQTEKKTREHSIGPRGAW